MKVTLNDEVSFWFKPRTDDPVTVEVRGEACDVNMVELARVLLLLLNVEKVGEEG